MNVEDQALKEDVIKVVSDPHVRMILCAIIAKAKSANELSTELGIPLRSVHRHVRHLSELGLLAPERSVFMRGGGKHTLHRSMINCITVKCQGDKVEVDLIPNEDILGKFMRFWSYMGR